jgi:hypothetical protein
VYATRANGRIYHLLRAQSNRTICGLKVSMVTAKPYPPESPLHAVSFAPVEKTLCKSCLGIKNEWVNTKNEPEDAAP